MSGAVSASENKANYDIDLYVTDWMNASYERDGILYADFRVGKYEENGEWTVSIYESMLTSQYAELIIFEAPNSNPDDVVLLENAQITVTMADGTVYEMSFPEGDRGSSWSIFQIET